ncbi:MAG: hypothetical protein DMF15_09200 [Verrucomicrobia bacterium]|nr:MAG: hypothetical protein DMF15_09200 [Verrucomicrobiota bacterium]
MQALFSAPVRSGADLKKQVTPEKEIQPRIARIETDDFQTSAFDRESGSRGRNDVKKGILLTLASATVFSG